jgi:hypothetical protein
MKLKDILEQLNLGLSINESVYPNEQENLLKVKENPDAISDIDNPSEAVQLAAVKQDGRVIEYIIDKGITPSVEVQLQAIKMYGANAVMNGIKAPSEAVQIAAINQDIHLLKKIRNPSEKVQLFAVTKSSDALGTLIIRLGITPSEKVQLEAVKRSGSVIEYIKNPSEAVQLEAVKNNIHCYKYIKKPSEAVKKYYEEHK